MFNGKQNRPFNKFSLSVLLDVSPWPWLWKTSSILTHFGWSCWMIKPNLTSDSHSIVPLSCFQRLGFTANTANTHRPANMSTQLAPEAASPKATRQIEIDCSSSCLKRHGYMSESIIFRYVYLFSSVLPYLPSLIESSENDMSDIECLRQRWTLLQTSVVICCYIHVMPQSKLCCFGGKQPPQYCI